LAIGSREAVLALDSGLLADAQVTWMGIRVPEHKYYGTYFNWSQYTDTSLSTLALGDSIAGVPAVVLGGVPLWPTWSPISQTLISDHAVWTSPMSDEYMHAILELGELRWLLQEPLIGWVEEMSVDCPACKGCECDMSPCATRTPLCTELFGADILCEEDACVAP
jgi:hypothetical protein